MDNVNFNPLLVHALTNISMEEISTSPSLSDLPGRLAPLIAQKKQQVPRAFPKNEFTFVCKHCKKRGRYDAGHISINLEEFTNNKGKGIEEYTQTTGYFRCKQCNSAGKWGITQDYQMRLMAALLDLSVSMEEDPLISISENQLFDGSSHQYASGAEEHLLNKILSDRDNAFLWNRLANLYFKGGRADLAAATFEHSLTLDPLQTESYYSLGMIIEAIDPKKSVDYYHRMLASASYYTGMDASNLRELIAVSLLSLIHLTSTSDGQVSIVPGKEIYEELDIEFQHPVEGHQTVFEGDVELDKLETFYPLAELFMGDRRHELSLRKTGASRKKKRNK